MHHDVSSLTFSGCWIAERNVFRLSSILATAMSGAQKMHYEFVKPQQEHTGFG